MFLVQDHGGLEPTRDMTMQMVLKLNILRTDTKMWVTEIKTQLLGTTIK